ncbi:hypothetical protein MRX96_003315 [Rhipicephalus microplus]
MLRLLLLSGPCDADRRHRYYEMKRVCYYLLPRRGGATDWSSELNPDVLDDTLCTHVLVGALAVSAQGRLVTKLPKHEDLISKISRSKLKVLLSVDAKDTTALSYVVAYRWTRLRFIRSAMRMVWRYKLSGINLDWQIPGWLSSHVGDRYLFRLLLQDFRSYMKETKKAFLLSASICAIPAVMPSTYDVRGLSRYVDFINLVAHDLDIYRPWRPNTSHHSPLFPKLLNKHGGLTAESCVSAVYQWAQLGMPHEKIVLGIPLYARIYRLADSSENKWGSKALGQAILPFNKVRDKTPWQLNSRPWVRISSYEPPVPFRFVRLQGLLLHRRSNPETQLPRNNQMQVNIEALPRQRPLCEYLRLL